MHETKPSRTDKTFTAIVYFVLGGIEIGCYVGMVGMWLFVGWAVWKFGWGEFNHAFWPALGVNAVLYGATKGIQTFKEPDD